jgi:hypothetical protein
MNRNRTLKRGRKRKCFDTSINREKQMCILFKEETATGIQFYLSYDIISHSTLCLPIVEKINERHFGSPK